MDVNDFAKNFFRLSMGAFFTVATLFSIYFMFWVFPVWQATWNRGWDNLNTIASSVDGVSQTVQPLSITAPVIVEQLEAMNATIATQLEAMTRHAAEMDQSIAGMKFDIHHMAATLPTQMGVMTDQMGRMQHNLTPRGMTQQLMPW